MLDILLSKILELFVNLGYTGLFISSFGIFPTEIVIAVLATVKEFDIYKIALVAALGEMLGSYPMYLLGYIFTGKKIYTWIENNGKYLKVDRKRFEESREGIKKKSYGYILLTRFVPWIRLVASIAGGFLRVNFILYSLAVFIGTYLYTYLLAYIASQVGDIHIFRRYILILDKWLVLLIFGYILIHWGYKNRKKISKWLKSNMKK